MAPAKPLPEDDRYYKIIHDALAVCADYRPKFGKGSRAGFTLAEFRELYQADAFYAWFGLDSPMVYAAHKAAGGMTSVYRQIGIGCEKIFRQVLQDTMGLNDAQANWSYKVPAPGGRERRLSLDGRIPFDVLGTGEKADRVHAWVAKATAAARVDPDVSKNLKGVVFEVRQGYKSKDSKRQNADVGNAANAYAASYLPAVVLMSVQIDSDIAERYTRAQWVLLRGTVGGSSIDSTYVFSKEVLGYDLAAFFQRNSERIKTQLSSIIEALLS